MTNYLIELSVIHVALVAAYWMFLKNESQYGKLRSYILAATALSLTIPALKLPQLFFQNEVVGNAIILPIQSLSFTEIAVASEASSTIGVEWIIWLGAFVSLYFLTRFAINLTHLVRLERTSSYEFFHQTKIRRTLGIKGSFTFFNWIFLAKDITSDQDEYDAILRHERAHATLGHTYDLIFLELFKAIFWWLPTAWFAKKEIKKIHEYQADAHAIKAFSIDRYSSILISSTLRANGLSLASSFHDGLIIKRLNAMKQQTKNVSPWKIGTVTMLTATLFIVFACSESSQAQNETTENKVFTKVEQQPEFPGGMSALVEFLGKEVKYPEQAEKAGIEGKVLIEFFVQKDGSITNTKVLKGIGSGCDEEALRAVNKMPNFIPGEQRGKKVIVKMVIPIMFALSDDKGSKKMGMNMKSDFNSMDVTADNNNGVWNGKVVDQESGKAMPGVNVIEESTNFGTVTDLDGTFSIALSDQSNDLILSYVGFKTSRLKATK